MIGVNSTDETTGEYVFLRVSEETARELIVELQRMLEDRC